MASIPTPESLANHAWQGLFKTSAFAEVMGKPVLVSTQHQRWNTSACDLGSRLPRGSTHFREFFGSRARRTGVAGLPLSL